MKMTPTFDGAWYDPVEDKERLKSQMGRVFKALADNRDVYLTCEEISKIININRAPHAPLTSISAQIRNLRKPKHGGWIVDSRYRRNTKIAEYKIEGQSVLNTENVEQASLL